MARSPRGDPSRAAARSSTRARSSLTAAWTALPAITVPRLAKLPTPYGMRSVSPCRNRNARAVDSERIGRDLGKAGLEPLTDVARAGRDDERPATFEERAGAFEGAGPRLLDEAGEPHSAAMTPRAGAAVGPAIRRTWRAAPQAGLLGGGGSGPSRFRPGIRMRAPPAGPPPVEPPRVPAAAPSIGSATGPRDRNPLKSTASESAAG